MIYIEPDQWSSDDSINSYALTMSTGQYIMDSANEPWSFYSPDDNLLRFEVQPGDHWENDPAGVERDEIAGTTQYAYGTPIDVSYSFMIEPGATNTATWLVVGQLHQNDYAGEAGASPPVAIMMIGEKMAVQIGWTDNAGVNHTAYIYVASSNIVRGQYYNMNISAKFDPSGGGQLAVTSDGQLLAEYTGPLGIAGHTSVFWKEGIYESASAQTLAVDYKNLSINSGASILSASSTPAVPSTASSISYSFAANDVVGVETVTNSDQSQNVYIYNTSGAHYLAIYQQYDSSGNLVDTIDYNPNGSRSSAQLTNADGSVTNAYYDVNGNLTKSVTNYLDGVVSVLYYVSNGLVERFIQNPDGSSMEVLYNSAGVETKLIVINANGSKTSTQYDIIGQNYVTQVTSYDAAGTETSITRSNASGVVLFSQTLTSEGTTTGQFSASGLLTYVQTDYDNGTVSCLTYDDGVLAQRYIEYAGGATLDIDYNSVGVATTLIQINADHSESVQFNDITGENYVAETDVYNAEGQLTSLTRTNAAGATVFSETTDSSGTTTVAWHTSSGVLTQTQSTTSSGVVTMDWFAANGAVTATEVMQSNGSYKFDKYNSSGALTQEIDCTPGVTLIAYDYNGLDYSNGVPQYAKNVTAYESGLTFASNGTNDTFNSFGGDRFMFTSGFGTDVINNFHVSGANADVIEFSAAVVPSYSSLAIRQSGADTLITLDALDSIRLTGVNASAFSQADVKFV